MNNLVLKPTIVWVVLLAFTALSLIFSEWCQSQCGDVGLTLLAVVVLACVKIRIIMTYFMELKTAPMPLRLAMDAWVLLVGAMVYFALS